MNTPKMIIFDYGDTLLCEPDVSFARGEKALFNYVVCNRDNLTPEQVSRFTEGLFHKLAVVREAGSDSHEWTMLRFAYEYLGIKLSISLPEAEKVIWDNASPGARMPHVEQMIDYINAKGIRSGVISNIGWSGQALMERINHLLPRNQFEFVIASSEYLFRKPNPMLFELALRKAGLEATDVWYCGDNIAADVEGSSAVGIFPVWYEDLTMKNPWRKLNQGLTPTCDHFHIHDWLKLIDVLEV